MKQLWKLLGRIGFWFAWPALWIYLRRAQRSRVLLVDDNTARVLVVKGWLSTQKWSLPGGGLHAGEDPKRAAARETIEETGVSLNPSDLQFLDHRWLRSKGFVTNTWLYAVVIPATTTFRRQRFEIIDIAWVEAATLTTSNAEPDVLLALQAWSAATPLVQ